MTNYKASNLVSIFLTGLMAVVAVVTTQTAVGQETAAAKTSSREFQLDYGATISGLPADAKVRVWFPIARSGQSQKVSVVSTQLPGLSKLETGADKEFGNQIGYFEFTGAGDSAAFNLKYNVTREESKTSAKKMKFSDKEKELFLQANRLVPTTGKPVELLKDKKLAEDRLEAGRQLYDLVNEHMKYDKSVAGYGKGDVIRACDIGTGNCTDFHSLFISLARNQKIPSRFEIGFPLPAVDPAAPKAGGEIKGYHCWAWFYSPEHAWVPVDISEADKNPKMRDYFFGNLTADRVAFSTGRDIELVPKAASEPLNYFIYPHVEVNGKVWPREKVKNKFGYQNK